MKVFVLADNVPFFSILYQSGTRATSISTTLHWIQERMTKRESVMKINATPGEQSLLLTVLEMNAKRLSSEYQPKRGHNETDFKSSFLIPMGPLSQRDIGKATNTSGCAVCGKRTTSKCTGCLSAEYCGRGTVTLPFKELFTQSLRAACRMSASRLERTQNALQDP